MKLLVSPSQKITLSKGNIKTNYYLKTGKHPYKRLYFLLSSSPYKKHKPFHYLLATRRLLQSESVPVRLSRLSSHKGKGAVYTSLVKQHSPNGTNPPETWMLLHCSDNPKSGSAWSARSFKLHMVIKTL